MYYKINKSTKTFKELMKLSDRIDQVRKEAKKLVKTFKGTGEYCKATHVLAGGIGAVEFKEKPEGWTHRGEKYQNLYMPKMDRNSKALWEKIHALPVVEYDELNKIVGFEGNQVVSSPGGLGWVNTVGIKWGGNFILMEIAKGAKFKANKDMKEIVYTEFEKLSSKIKEKN
jgi:hypothetical protein